MNLAQAILVSCTLGGYVSAKEIAKEYPNIAYGSEQGPKRNPSYTKKGPGRRFAGAREQLERNPLLKAWRNALALAKAEGYGQLVIGAPYNVMMPNDQIVIRNGAAWVRNGTTGGNRTKVVVA